MRRDIKRFALVTGASSGIGAIDAERALSRSHKPSCKPRPVHDPAISTFIVDYPPGASAMLHRTPTSGYVLVHVLAGTIRAFAWHAGVGTYRAGQTWSEPAVANDIATANGSTWASARVLVVLITGAQDQKTETVTE